LLEVTIYTKKTQVGVKKLTKSQHPEYNSVVHLQYHGRLFTYFSISAGYELELIHNMYIMKPFVKIML